jgi:hypothetical protein
MCKGGPSIRTKSHIFKEPNPMPLLKHTHTHTRTRAYTHIHAHRLLVWTLDSQAEGRGIWSCRWRVAGMPRVAVGACEGWHLWSTAHNTHNVGLGWIVVALHEEVWANEEGALTRCRSRSALLWYLVTRCWVDVRAHQQAVWQFCLPGLF